MACRADLCSELEGVIGVGACSVPIADGCQGGCQVNAECRLSTDERRVKLAERARKDGVGVGVAEPRECVAAPAGEVDSVECDVRPLVARWLAG